MHVATAPRTRWLFLAVIGAQLADVATFLPAIHKVGIGAEQNPLARALFMTLGSAGPVVLKVVATALILALLWRVAVRYPALTGRTALIAVVIGSAGAWSNIAFGLIR